MVGDTGKLLKGGTQELLKGVSPGTRDSGKSSSSPGDLLKGILGGKK
jgi:hypothetical protein